MYSAQIYKEDFLMCRKIIKPYSSKIEKILDKCNKALLEYKRECETYVVYENVGNLIFQLMRLTSELDEFLQKPLEFQGRKDITDFYFQVRNFLSIYDLVDEHYVIYSQLLDDGRFMLKLFCVDPSLNIQNCLDKANASIFFSATLLPINYYKSLLSTKKDNYAIYAQSIFDEKKRLLVFGKDVSTKYTRRNAAEFEKMTEYIYRTVKCKKGNYMIFFPSYKLMNQVYDIFTQRHTDFDTIIQKSGMKEEEREEFLEAFTVERDSSLVAFCVMGGIFGEGIDLKNEQLIGVIVVGTGLPQISYEREILKNYYDSQNGCGFDYAFRYPGINKVLQAAGRVIRTVDDNGVILLLDERFLQPDYEPLYPREWKERIVCGIEQLEGYVEEFWSNIN
ncbi:MAG: helicase C-terminal domain-containing protein, partial [Agathobacter sp.]|nr:helicase C-terminal domain-containing protein [Agathobacter sp.]